jgi:hypothetical protein
MKEGVIFPIPEAEVYKIVKKAVNTLFKGSPNKEQFDDLVQNSMVRLVDVFNRYDPQKGSFSNFVYMQVNWAIWRDNVHYSAKGRRRDFMVESLDYVIKDNDPEDYLESLLKSVKYEYLYSRFNVELKILASNYYLALSTTIDAKHEFSIFLFDEEIGKYDPTMDSAGYYNTRSNKLLVQNKYSVFNVEHVIHELSHKTMREIFNHDANPYNTDSSKSLYHQAVKNTFT